MKTYSILKAISLGLCLIYLTGCNGGSTASSGQSSTSNGTLTFSPNNGIKITKGSIRRVTFSLENSTGVVNQKVNFSVSNTSLATVSPASCVVSSGSTAASSCVLTLSGSQNGNVNLIAQSAGYSTVQATSTVTDEVQYGTLRIVGESNGSYTALYPALESAPHTIYVEAVLDGSSGVTDANALLANLSESSPYFVFTPGIDVQQCSLTTEKATCSIQGTLNANQNVSTTLKPVGVINQHYTSIPVEITGTTKPDAGVITVTTQNSSRIVYTTMHAPLFVNWSKFNGIGEPVNVTLTIQDPDVLKFYNYSAGKYTLSNTKTCTLTPAAPSCGLGLSTLKAGSAAITVAVTQQNDYIPAYDKSVSVVVDSASTSGRTITFTNNTESKISLGLTSGAAGSFTGPNDPTSSQPINERAVPGAGSMCGISNPGAACPIGATCAQGGANPNESTPYFCYWDNIAPTNGSYEVAAGSSSTLFISSSSGITSGAQQIQWSGNYHAVPCPNDICPAVESSFGTGPAYPAVTLAEVTYQHNTIDYYDVSIINGINYALEFGPNNQAIDTSDAYTCGTAGSFTPMDGGWSDSDPLSAAGLPGSPWFFAPTESAIIQSSTGSPSSYFATVIAQVPSQACTDDSPCNSGNVCGWDSTQVTTGTYPFLSSARVCGVFVSWATADQIYGWNESTTNEAPFNFAATTSVSPSYQDVSAISVGDLQLCINNTYSAYGIRPTNPNGGQPASTAMACGGVNWNDLGITRPREQAVTVNSFWMSEVLPTITWLKQACPTCYTFPYDDMTSTFTCQKSSSSGNIANYTITISDLAQPL